MNGLELSEKYYYEFGKPMLQKEFPEIIKYLAIGLVGSGSERYGFDDEISKDHDYEVGFCIFLPDESVIDRKTEFLLERAYYKLPKEYEGIKRSLVLPVGGNRFGVIRTAEFYKDKIGSLDGGLTIDEWLTLPDYCFFEATNGKVFEDNYGEFSRVRKTLSEIPEDVRRKRLVGNLLKMAQSGQYNYNRCINHGEKESAMLSATEFVDATIKTAFLLIGKFAPYYKWSVRALKNIEDGKIFADNISKILLTDGTNDSGLKVKQTAIDEICRFTAEKIRKQGLTEMVGDDLERLALSINDKIENAYVRNLNVLTTV